MVTVTAMGPCPPIQKGKGRVVTMTVTHENSNVFELELSGFDAQGRALTETLCPTDVHKLYSVERGWVMTKNLHVGEVLRTQQGAATITSIKRKAGDHRVYNFEVEATHTYFVGHTRTLSHNVDCPVTKSDIAGYLPDKGVNSGQSLVPYDPEFASKQILRDHSPTGHMTPGGRTINPHAAERMVTPPPGRAPMTKSEVDQVLDQGDKIRKTFAHPEGRTVTVQHTGMPGKPQVVIDAATGQRVVTVINPKCKP